MNNQNTNYVQAGDTIACGHCIPKQGFTLPETYKMKCDCFCHRTRTNATSGTGGTISLPRKSVKWFLWVIVIALLIINVIYYVTKI